jgi:putative membrane protein
MKKSILNLTLVTALVFSLSSCSNNQKTEDTKEVANEQNDQKFDSNKKEKDADFLVDAAEINMMEIQLGQLAQTNGVSQDVKSMGKMMEDSHSKSLTELKGLAAKKTITLPESITEDNKDSYEKLSKKTGKDFDKEYCDKMVDGHKDAISKFEKAAENSEDMDVKEWARATLPTLREHLDHALACQEKCKKM